MSTNSDVFYSVEKTSFLNCRVSFDTQLKSHLFHLFISSLIDCLFYIVLFLILLCFIISLFFCFFHSLHLSSCLSHSFPFLKPSFFLSYLHFFFFTFFFSVCVFVLLFVFLTLPLTCFTPSKNVLSHTSCFLLFLFYFAVHLFLPVLFYPLYLLRCSFLSFISFYVLIFFIRSLVRPACLRVSPDRSQFFRYDSISLSCEHQLNSTGWRVKRKTTVGGVRPCSSGWGSTSSSSTCIIGNTYPTDSGVYWCESEDGERSNSVNITITGTAHSTETKR